MPTTERRIKKPQDHYFDQMRALSRYYHELDEERAMLRSRMHTLLQLTFPEMESLFTQKSISTVRMPYASTCLALFSQSYTVLPKKSFDVSNEASVYTSFIDGG